MSRVLFHLSLGLIRWEGNGDWNTLWKCCALLYKPWKRDYLSISPYLFQISLSGRKMGARGLGDAKSVLARFVFASLYLNLCFSLPLIPIWLYSQSTWRYMSLPQPDQKVQCTYVWIGENIKQINNLSAFADIFICQHFQPIVTITWGGISNLFCNTSKNHDVLIIDSVDVEHNN